MANKFETRPPDYILSVKDRETNVSTKVGAGWLNEKGHISVRINPCVVIDWKDDVFVTLFPNDERH